MTEQVEMTPEQLAANPAIRALMQQAAEAALRAADKPNPADRPGGSVNVPNVNLNRPQRLSLAKAIIAIRESDWRGAELERDFGQATRALYMPDAAGNSLVYPANPLAFVDVIEKAQINLAQATPALRDWAARAAGEATTAAGGALVPPQFLQDQFVLSLQTAVVFRNLPGVDSIPVTSNLAYFPRETVIPGASGYAEAGTINATDPTFGQQAITIKKTAALNRFSNELLADSTPAFERYIGRSLARSVALKEDYQFLEGAGSGAAILGMGSYTGMTTAGATGASWSKGGTGTIGIDYARNMVYLARTAGWEPNAWVMHPRTLHSLEGVKDANGRYVLESAGGVFGAPVMVPNIGALPTQITYQTPPWKAMLLGIPVYLSAQIPVNESTAGTGATHVYLGDFNFARVLERQAVEIAMADQIYFTTDQTAVRTSVRSAIVLTAPAAFMKQTGVKA